MPLVRISLMAGKPVAFLKVLGDTVHQAMVKIMNVPPLDRFQVVTEISSTTLFYDAEYLGIKRTDEIVMIQIALNQGRIVDAKCKFYQRTAQLLEQLLKIRPEDVMINLIEVQKENWSFGLGVAQYAEDPNK
jgi:4-oxalocrotonate tautomerase